MDVTKDAEETHGQMVLAWWFASAVGFGSGANGVRTAGKRTMHNSTFVLLTVCRLGG